MGVVHSHTFLLALEVGVGDGPLIVEGGQEDTLNASCGEGHTVGHEACL